MLKLFGILLALTGPLYMGSCAGTGGTDCKKTYQVLIETCAIPGTESDMIASGDPLQYAADHHCVVIEHNSCK